MKKMTGIFIVMAMLFGMMPCTVNAGEEMKNGETVWMDSFEIERKQVS